MAPSVAGDRCMGNADQVGSNFGELDGMFRCIGRSEISPRRTVSSSWPRAISALPKEFLVWDFAPFELTGWGQRMWSSSLVHVRSRGGH